MSKGDSSVKNLIIRGIRIIGLIEKGKEEEITTKARRTRRTQRRKRV
jgi:hypothetical protein